MLYAIVDIETTGSYAHQAKITEVGVVITDGKKIIDTYETLLDPGHGIPPYIQALTGITDDMVEGARTFDQIADELFEMLQDKIFVAHNVNFDFGFLKHEFQACKLDFRPKRLCTVRLGRAVIPGLKSYSLGKLTAELGIEHGQAHRALGDALATAEFFHMIVEKDAGGAIEKSLKGNSHEMILPAKLDKEVFVDLPKEPGVYYFHDSKGKIIYIGKAKSLKKRVASHFTGNIKSKKKQDLYREVADISIQKTGTELIAGLLEDKEIRKHWPRLNSAQKSRSTRIGVFLYNDQNGHTRLAINKVTNSAPTLIEFSNIWEARTWLIQKVEKYGLNPELCGLPEFMFEPYEGDHEKNLQQCMDEMDDEQPTYLIYGMGRHNEERSFVWVERGSYRGFGFFPDGFGIESKDHIETFLIEQKETGTTRGIIGQYLEKKGKKAQIHYMNSTEVVDI